MELAGRSSASVLAFLWLQTLRNAVRTKVGRLKEPRYLFGGLMALAWMASILTRGGRGNVLARKPPKTTELFELLTPAGAFALAVLVTVWWLFERGKAALALTEAEVQFLFPAPLPRAAVLHYVVLKAQVGILASSAFLTLVMSRSMLPSALRAFPALFLLLAVLQLHHQGLSLRRAAWAEAPAARRWSLAALSRGGALLALALLTALAVLTVRQVAGITSLGEIGPALERALDGNPLGLLLWPFRALLAPLFARDALSFLRALPIAVLLLVLQHFWVVRAQVRFEDATSELAARRARDRERRKLGRTAPPSDRRRLLAPFPLQGPGLPEAALLWKGLLAAGRVRGASFAITVSSLAILAFVAGRAAARLWPTGVTVAHGIAATMPMMVVAVCVLILPMNLRLDFRRDLLQASTMKLWPLSPTRVAAGELAAPLVLCTALVWSAMAVSLALMAGAGAPPQLPFSRQLPLALAAAMLAPLVIAIILVVQNGLTLAFPMWFPPSATPSRGFASSGSNLIAFLATFLLLGVGLAPGALVGGILVALGRSTLDFWVAPLAAAAAALPLAGEVAAGVYALGRLFARFDPSVDLESA